MRATILTFIPQLQEMATNKVYRWLIGGDISWQEKKRFNLQTRWYFKILQTELRSYFIKAKNRLELFRSNYAKKTAK